MATHDSQTQVNVGPSHIPSGNGFLALILSYETRDKMKRLGMRTSLHPPKAQLEGLVFASKRYESG